MLRRPFALFSLLMCLVIGPLGLGCGAQPDAPPASTSGTEEDVEVPTVELPDDTSGETQDPAGE